MSSLIPLMDSIRLSKLYPFLLAIVPVYTWSRFLYSVLLECRELARARTVFMDRHNCVVTYCPSRGMTGWPPHKKPIPIVMPLNMSVILEPITYFIDTAQCTLNVAIMSLSSYSICWALAQASNRGVLVRVLLHYGNAVGPNDYKRRLLECGVQLAFFIPKVPVIDSIMHHKYIVKDYKYLEGGFLMLGSANFHSDSTFLQNYEDIAFTTNVEAVIQFHINFENCWLSTKQANEEIYDRTVLEENSL